MASETHPVDAFGRRASMDQLTNSFQSFSAGENNAPVFNAVMVNVMGLRIDFLAPVRSFHHKRQRTADRRNVQRRGVGDIERM